MAAADLAQAHKHNTDCPDTGAALGYFTPLSLHQALHWSCTRGDTYRLAWWPAGGPLAACRLPSAPWGWTGPGRSTRSNLPRGWRRYMCSALAWRGLGRAGPPTPPTPRAPRAGGPRDVPIACALEGATESEGRRGQYWGALHDKKPSGQSGAPGLAEAFPALRLGPRGHAATHRCAKAPHGTRHGATGCGALRQLRQLRAQFPVRPSPLHYYPTGRSAPCVAWRSLA